MRWDGVFKKRGIISVCAIWRTTFCKRCNTSYCPHILNLRHANVYSGLNLNQDKATKPQTVQIVRQGEATLYWFKFNPL
ncbi:hypothetical protein FGF65_11640 [Neisseria meningitidis]|nr:hypothetical protein [Neisseria meningitidis]